MKAVKHTVIESDVRNRVTVDTIKLKEILCCGRSTAERIGNKANAKIVVGKRVLWNVEKIQMYLNSISE